MPFVDVLNTMLDDTLPLTPPEWPEWGNPIESEKDFRTILSYSPYDNLAAKDYPAILAMGGLTDPRVTYWEPAKWIARLRATMSGGGPVLLRTNMGAGHGGASGRFNRLDEVAIVYAFALWAAGTGGEERGVNVRPTPELGGGQVRSAISAILRNCSRVVPPAACTAMPCRIAER